MKILKRHIAIAFLILVSPLTLMAQSLGSAYFLEGYNHRSDMNPAFAAEHAYITFPAIGNINSSFRGNFGIENVLYDKGGDKLTTFMSSSVNANEFLSGLSRNNRLASDMRLELLSAGFKAFGGFNTVGVSVRSNVAANIPYEFFEFMKTASNKTYNIDGLKAHADAFAEISLGHSHKVSRNLRIGAQLKFLLGVGNVDMEVQNMKVALLNDAWSVSGRAVVDASVKGLQYETETKSMSDGRTYEQVKDVDVKNSGLNGFGVAVDLGAEMDLSNVVPGLKLSAALLDLGAIKWNNDMRASSRGGEFVFSGFNNVAVDDKGSDNSLGNQWDDISDDLKNFAHLSNEGNVGGRSKALAATLNVGAQYTLQSYDKLSFGLLSTTRLDGDYSWTEARVSANVAPVKALEFSASYALSTFGSSLGLVANVHASGFNLTLGTDHVVGKVCKQGIPMNSNGSVSLGISLPL